MQQHNPLAQMFRTAAQQAAAAEAAGQPIPDVYCTISSKWDSNAKLHFFCTSPNEDTPVCPSAGVY